MDTDSTLLPPDSRVTVIDDDEEGREEITDLLRDFGFTPSAIEGEFGDQLDNMVAAIEATNPSFVICDNRLQARKMAQFYGAAVVRALVERGRPAMLLTTYRSPDRMRLRESRFEVPVIVDRDSFAPEKLRSYFDICHREIMANPVDQRRPHRSLIRIDNVSGEQSRQIDAVVPAWRPDHAVPIPMACIASHLRDQVRPGVYLLGDVNIGATHEDELFFHNVNEIAPPPSKAIA